MNALPVRLAPYKAQILGRALNEARPVFESASSQARAAGRLRRKAARITKENLL